jgi:hypothetical protein
MTKQTLLLVLALAAAGPASAAPIYRCGSTYSQVPCPEGGKVVEATDPRSAAQRAEARRIAAAERKAAADRERERREKEKADQPAAPASLGAAPAASAPASAPAGAKKKAAKAAATADKDFIATAPRDKAPGK